MQEAGAIPVTKRVNPLLLPAYDDSYWRLIFGTEVPFIEEDTWEAALRSMEAALADPPALEARRRAVADAWQRHKAAAAGWVSEMVRAHPT